MTKLAMEALVTEDGDPWGVYAYGHVDPALVTLELMNEALDYAGLDPIEKGTAQHLWICDASDEEDGNPDFPWNWCGPDAVGAIAVTGINLRS